MMSNLPFLGFAALMTLTVLAWLLYPLLKTTGAAKTASRRALNTAIYRDQLAELERDRAAGNLAAAHYQQARLELQHRLLQDTGVADAAPVAGSASAAAAAGSVAPARRTALILSLLLPLAAALLYLWLGNPAAIEDRAAKAEVSMGQVDDLVAKLAARLENNPDDVKGWTMLARSYKALRRFDEAEKAFGHLAGVLDSDPNLLTEYADLLAVRANGNLEGKPLELVNRALKLDPSNTMALALAGTAAYNRQDFAEATRLWETLLRLLPAESENAKSLSATLAELHAKHDNGVGHDSRMEKAVQAGQADKNKISKAELLQSVSGIVALAPALSSKIQPGDTLYVYARAAEGPRMPLAVLRVRAGDLPLAFTLDDTLAINPQMKISGATRIIVEARVSKSGNATPQPGDLRGESGPVPLGAREVKLVIERVAP